MPTPHQRGTYSILLHETWTDDAFEELRYPARLLFLWSFTHSPAASLTGLSHASPVRMMNVHGFTTDELHSALEDLERKPLAIYDERNEVLWCVNRAAYALRSERSVKQALTVVRNMPPSPLLDAWRRRYAEAIGDAA
jgi:hypothetical protein